MIWIQVDRTKRIQPATGTYNDWKEQIALDCHHRCVYCSIGEQPWGGIDHYHIDHFKPKSIFEALTNVVTNLYYSCPVCNRFKSDDWPSDSTDLNEICYPDPSDYDYGSIFELDETNSILAGKVVAARYVLERLYLNRPQLIYERREHFLNREKNILIEEAKHLLDKVEDVGLLRELSRVMISLQEHMERRKDIRPYSLVEITKPKLPRKKQNKVVKAGKSSNKTADAPKKIMARKTTSAKRKSEKRSTKRK